MNYKLMRPPRRARRTLPPSNPAAAKPAIAELLAVKRAVDLAELHLGKLLDEAKQEGYWELRGHATFEEFCVSIALSNMASVNSYMKRYRAFRATYGPELPAQQPLPPEAERARPPASGPPTALPPRQGELFADERSRNESTPSVFSDLDR